MLPFTSGRDHAPFTGVIGIGDPVRDAFSRYVGCGDDSPGGGVVLMTRNCRRDGVFALGRRSRSVLALRGDLVPELLGERCSTCTGVG